MMSLASLKKLDASLTKATTENTQTPKNRRTCDMCGKTKPLIAFHNSQTHCKRCHTRKVLKGKHKRPNNIISKGTRNTVKRRANGRCEHCGAESNLELHHVKPVCLHPELGNSVSNLKALCPACHKAEHAKPGMDHTTLARKANALRRR